MSTKACKAKTCFGRCMNFVKKPKQYCHVHDPNKRLPRLKQKIVTMNVQVHRLQKRIRALEREQLKLEAEQEN